MKSWASLQNQDLLSSRPAKLASTKLLYAARSDMLLDIYINVSLIKE
jgi:hypothetical protein